MGCGANHDTPLNKDHYFPKQLLSLPGNYNPEKNPFRWMVMNRRNLFTLCRYECHQEADKRKSEAIYQDGDFDPVGLIMALQTHPTTEDPKYRNPVISFKIQDHWNFIHTVRNLTREFNKNTITKFQEAAEASMGVITSLEEMKIVTPIG